LLPTNIKFPEVRLVDHLKQAATDIVTILTHPPSTTVPSLHAGDPVRNALLDIATTLKNVDSIPEPVKTTPVVLPQDRQPPRVQKNPPHTTIPIKSLLQHSKLPQNNRFENTGNHNYNLRPRIRQTPRRFQAPAVEQLVAQQIFEKAYMAQINHIYNANGKKENIDSVCKGP
jgi:hypothetical protein